MKLKKQSLREILILHLKGKSGQIVHGGQMERVSQSYGYEAETGKRILRDLTNYLSPNFNAHIKKDYQEGCVVYWYK